MAVMAYGSPSRRVFEDLDLLLLPAQIHDAYRLLRDDGFIPQLDLTEEQFRIHMRMGGEVALRGASGDCHVELGTGLAERFFLDARPDLLWAHRSRVEVDGLVIPTLSPPLAAVAACVHGTKHLWSRLVWLADVASLMSGISTWHDVLAHAQSLRSRRMVCLGVGLANRLLGAAIPGPIEQIAVHDPGLARAQAAIAGLLCAGEAEGLSFRRAARLHLSVRDTWRDALRYIAAFSFTPSYRDWKALPLHGRLLPICRWLRPLRMAVDALAPALRRGSAGDGCQD
jgi:hypothetical protein